MYRRLIFVFISTLLAATIMQARQREALSATSIVGWPPAPAVAFVASNDKKFDQLMGDAMSVMYKGMHPAAQTGEPDHDFVTMMIPHHQGAMLS